MTPATATITEPTTAPATDPTTDDERTIDALLRGAVERDHPRLCFVRLPSSSPANASWSRERKLAAWRAVSAALRT